LLAAVVLAGCRVPDPPVIPDKSVGIIYDTAMEQEIRDGTMPAIATEAYARYVDTLAEPVAVTRWGETDCDWEIFVATNRGCLRGAADQEANDGGANTVLKSVSFGRARVQLPRQQRGVEPRVARRPGRLGVVPVVGRKPDPEPEDAAHAVAEPLSASAFVDGVAAQVARSRQKDVLVFVHGFNVNFEAALVRTAQVAFHMPFNGAVVSYCWPSQGGLNNYEKDEPINKASVAPFLEFLETLRTGLPAEARIQIVVHSMGNRIVMEALSERARQSGRPLPHGRRPFANVVLCAPDVGQSDFRAWAPGVVAQSERVTLYCHSGDSALIVSKGLHREMRAGDAWEPQVLPGIETVDCSRIDLTLMAHSYYGSNKDVLSDLFMLLKEDLPAARRGHLTPRTSDAGATYYEFAKSAPAIYFTWHFE